jgi:hypothetical protein
MSIAVAVARVDLVFQFLAITFYFSDLLLTEWLNQELYSLLTRAANNTAFPSLASVTG